MFHSRRHIAHRHGKHSAHRQEYLQLLVDEYKTTEKLVARQQVLANLANFAYDPVNYDWLWKAKAIGVFLEALEDQDTQLREFGAGGIANLCLDPTHRDLLLSDPRHVESIAQLVAVDAKDDTTVANTVVNALITLMFLLDTQENLRLQLPAHFSHALGRWKQNPVTGSTVALFLADYASRCS
ncbi:hypothetical protein BC940DRAFT_291763 [Gongronella butleri]|nr:hypothetical protein BC940DRAFT_291763 [Gongronella butleri]